MVDPDNRRPVDYSRRITVLKEIQDKTQSDILKLIDELFASKEDGRIKLFLTHRVLQARKENVAVFQKGEYQPLEVAGKFKEHIVAFARYWNQKTIVAVAPRFLTGLIQPGELPLGDRVWEDTHILMPQGMPTAWKDAISTQSVSGEGTLPVGKALQYFPVALLTS
jgi:(1->4)-alpha-D-glucan 1-alpha-D-glucosylmutase